MEFAWSRCEWVLPPLPPGTTCVDLVDRHTGVWGGRWCVALREIARQGGGVVESYPEPDYVWQSTSANTDFEAKLSLSPLAFGTLKAAFYAIDEELEDAARNLGVSDTQIMLKHILPNALASSLSQLPFILTANIIALLLANGFGHTSLVCDWFDQT